MPIPLSDKGMKSPRLSLTASQSSVPVNNDSQHVRGKKVLIVDDNHQERGETQARLLKAGVKSAVPVDCAEAAALFAEKRPLHTMFDVVLLDWRCPNVQGIPFPRLLSDTYNGTELRVFITEPNARPHQSRNGLHVLSKPIVMHELEHLCSLPPHSLWGPVPAEPVHPLYSQTAPGSPSHSFNIDSWRQTNHDIVQDQRRQLAPGAVYADDEETDYENPKKYHHATPHDEPHGMTFGMSHDELSKTEQNMMLFAAFAFFIAAVACFIKYTTEVKKDNPKHLDLYVATTGVSMMAFCAYLAKSIGQGYITVNGVTICHVRYIDWFCTTPLMIYDLTALAGASTATSIFTILVDLCMIVFGIVGMSSAEWRHKCIWYFVACVFYIVLIYLLLSPIQSAVDREKSKATQDVYGTLVTMTIVSWTAYPMVTLNGPNGVYVNAKGVVGCYSHHTEAILIVFLDLVSKIGFEAILIFSDY